MKTKKNRGTLNENNIESASKVRLSQGCKYLKNIFAKGSPIVDAFHNGELEKHESDAIMFISEFAHKFGDTGNEPNEEYLNYLYDCAEIIYSISNKLGGHEGARIYCEIGRAMSNIKSYEECKKDEELSMKENKKNTIRLTESELKKIISESVKNVLKEATVSENQLADRTYPLIGDLIDEWDSIRDGMGGYPETATRVVGALQNVLNVLREISREHKEKGMGGYDFSRFPRPDDGGWIE